jgi:hypothetical protein
VATLPISFGYPFGLSVLLPVNLPLPTKITAQILEPDRSHRPFGDDPDIYRVDAHVRSVMQTALDKLAAERRFSLPPKRCGRCSDAGSGTRRWCRRRN